MLLFKQPDCRLARASAQFFFIAVSLILRAVQFCALPVSIEKGIRPHAFLPVG
jgi:hypothetical protein